jgi:hypothetical protein
VEEILYVTRAYLASWPAEEACALPEGCWPSRLHGPQDIEHWTDRLLAATTNVMLLDDERRLDRITNHFLIASVRLRQLSGAPVGHARLAA